MIRNDISFVRNGCTLHCELLLPEEGKGPFPVVILSHGFNGCSEHSIPYAEIFLKHGIAAVIFDFIGGAGTDSSRTSKTEVIEYVLRNIGSPEKSRVLMIGDRDNDVIGAQGAGIKCMGVLWGYGSGKELAETGADYIAETPQKAADTILS